MSKRLVEFTYLKLYGATSLMLASKSIELDERIPFISKLRRHTYLPFLAVEFKTAEFHLIKELGW